MALLTTLRVGCLPKLCKDQLLLSRTCDVWHMQSANIYGKAMIKGHELDKPKPWPYLDRGYCALYSYFDSTSKRFTENSRVLFVEGPPAIGKSKLALALAEEFDMKYFPMPTLDYLYINHYGWDSRVADPFLSKEAQCYDEKKFLKEPHHPSTPVISFNLYYLKVSQYIDALCHLFNTGQGVVLERSLFSDYAFAEAMYKCGFIYKAEIDAYYKIRTKILEDMLRPHMVIYLDASVDTVLDNFKKRGLGEEKVYDRKFLTILEETYKRKALVDLEKHAEVLVYDWNKPEDAEIVIEDIERVDLNRFDRYTEKLKDWRVHGGEEGVNELRWLYTQRKRYILCDFNAPLLNCPRIYWTADQKNEILEYIEENPVSGYKYMRGFNPNKGDNVWWKWTKPAQPYIHQLPEYVTDMLIQRVRNSP